ncbi:MAG: radical SAM protein [Candidatus Lokiarchaeota archaeon]|nr:radical SAM protein [Candidatus Lokiarchaeota archaeon]
MAKETDKCEVCGTLLESGVERRLTCQNCGLEFKARVACPAGHYICDACHSRDALVVMRAYLKGTKERNPFVMADTMLSNPAFNMYGPEHHVLVPAVLVAAARNNGCKKADGSDVADHDLEECFNRSSQIPGGWCGFYGACGAGIGAGVATSVLARATPSTSASRSAANRATSEALSRIADDLEHCCKRSTRLAIAVGLASIREVTGCSMDFDPGPCPFAGRNPKCEGAACQFFR